MSLVDPEDDTLTRYVVQHYKYVQERHERKLVVIRAYSKKRQAFKLMKSKSKELLNLQARGLADASEYICSGVMRSGQKERSSETRLTLRKMKSGWITQGLSKKQTNGKPDPLPKEE